MYSSQILILIFILVILLFGCFIAILVLKSKEAKLNDSFKSLARFSNEELLTFNEVHHDIFEVDKAVKQLASFDGYEPSPLSYQVITDGGVDMYVRTFTVDKLPKTLRFAETWSAIANFDGAFSAIYTRPKSKRESETQLDKHISELEAEKIRASKPEVDDINRVRKLSKQKMKAENWAELIENEDDTFFDVGFLIAIMSDDLSKLALKSDTLRDEAKKKGILLSGCFGVQKEAFLSILPFNHIEKSNNTLISPPIKWHTLNKRSLACLYNHKTERFEHKNGVPIGRGLYDGYPYLWDPYDKSYVHGFSAIFAGDMGVGKSSSAKAISSRLINWGFRFVAIDSQSVAGKGEYTNEARANNGTVFVLSNNSDTIVNMFDVNTEIVDGYETLNLSQKIDFLELSILTMLAAEKADFKVSTYMSDILQVSIREIYANRGIYDGDAESLYTQGSVMSNGHIGVGRVKKEVPTLSDCYKQILINSRGEKVEGKKEVYDIILSGLRRWIRGVYFSTNKIRFFTKEEYEALDSEYIDGKSYKYIVENGKKDIVVAVEGSSSFFDGQSTVSLDVNSPFTSFDISSLTQREKRVARAVLMPYIEEYFIKPNNEDITKANKLIVIMDEAHEQWAVGEAARTQCQAISRTCRKKNVGIWWLIQACADCDVTHATQTIFKQSEVKFIFRQSRMDDEFLAKNLPLSETQRKRIYNLNGVKKNSGNEYSKPGQVCVVNNDSVHFLQIELMPGTEDFVVETDMRKLEEKHGKGAIFWESLKVN